MSDDLSKIAIKDVELFGEKTKTRHMLEDIQGDEVKDYGEKRQVRVSLGPLTKKEYEYQDYTLRATVIVYRTETEFKEEEISILLKTDYSKERRSDWFDEKTSV